MIEMVMVKPIHTQVHTHLHSPIKPRQKGKQEARNTPVLDQKKIQMQMQNIEIFIKFINFYLRFVAAEV
jgi:hypothetical protein